MEQDYSSSRVWSFWELFWLKFGAWAVTILGWCMLMWPNVDYINCPEVHNNDLYMYFTLSFLCVGGYILYKVSDIGKIVLLVFLIGLIFLLGQSMYDTRNGKTR